MDGREETLAEVAGVAGVQAAGDEQLTHKQRQQFHQRAAAGQALCHARQQRQVLRARQHEQPHSARAVHHALHL